MMISNCRRFMALSIALFFSLESNVCAEYSNGIFSLSAFGTLGGAWLSNQNVDFSQGSLATGPGRSHDFDVGLDSRLGAQLNVALTPRTLITVQSVVERLSDNSFEPRLTQANIRHELTDDLAVRIGRLQSPVFLASDYRLANFSNPWVRAPGVLYNIYPLTHLDAADFTYRLKSDLGLFSLNAGYGWVSYPFPAGGTNGGKATATLNLDNVFFANLKLDKEAWRYKLSWLHAQIDANLKELDDFIVGLSALDPRMSEALPFTNLGVDMYTFGFSYDSDNWLVMGEWGIALLDRTNLFSDLNAGYLTAGYRIDRWMPHITLGYRSSSDSRVHSGNAIVDSTLAGLHQLQRSDYQTLAIGLNYSVNDFMILRGQLDLIEPTRFSRGPYMQDVELGGHYNLQDPGVDALFSVSLDFVY